MATEVRDLRPAADGVFLLSVTLQALRTDPRITMFLLAMPFKRHTQVSDNPDRPPVHHGAATLRLHEVSNVMQDQVACDCVPLPRFRASVAGGHMT